MKLVRPALLLLIFALGCRREDVLLADGLDASVSASDGSIGDRDGGVVIPPGLMGLEVRPPNAQLRIDGVAPYEEVSFSAIGQFDSGDRDLSDIVSWSVDKPFLGSIESGRFVSAGVGGTGVVTASLGAFEATASLNITLELISFDPELPATAATRFSGDPANDRTGRDAPVIVYPSDGTEFPLNVSNTLFQWEPGPGQDLFELRFESSVASLRFYTGEPELLMDEDSRNWIARTHAGRSVSVSVRGVSSTSSAAPYRSDTITIEYSQSEVLGALYYWSTGAEGIMRATLDGPMAVKFFPTEGDDTCASCHTVSRDGRRFSLGYDGENLMVGSIPDRDNIYPEQLQGEERKYGWGTFNPGASTLLYAHKGALELIDLDTGDAAPVPLPDKTYATHPDWAPNGSYVAVALLKADRAPGNKDVTGSSLARLEVLPGGGFGEPEILVESSAADDTLYFPTYSPDSQWIAFARTTGKSKDSKPAELYLVRSDGSSAPILLERLDRRVGPDDDIQNIGNSMPTWAPSTRPEINWLAFSSLRDYGRVLVGTDRDQLWAAAIDLDRAAAGSDPSYPAFWLPFQALEEGNHRAFWTLNLEDSCPSSFEICDGLDNDCDGIVDNDCCTPNPPEVCGDAIDNDCDSSIDEACCEVAETCNNGLDDDCDGLVDLNDEDCAF